MNIGTRLLLSAALAVGSTIGAAALGQTVVRDAQAEITSAPAGASGTGVDAATAAQREATAQQTFAQQKTVAEREAAVRGELLAAAEAGQISWAAAERVGNDLGSYIRGDRRASTI